MASMIVINFNSNGTMTDGYLRMWDGTKISMTNWQAYELYTKAALEGRKVISVMHNDSSFTDSIEL